MSRIDAATERAVQDRSKDLGGGSVAPERSFSSDPGGHKSDWTATKIPSSNPAPVDLQYSTASEARDVAKRLEEYQQDAARPYPGQEPRSFTLTDSLRTGQISASEFLSAEEAYILAAINLLTTRHLWSPRFFNDTTVGVAGRGIAGDYQHALSIVNNLRVTKRLPYGGAVEAAWITQATDQLRDQATGGYVQSSSLALSGTIPLLRGAGTIAREDIIQAERNLIYQARTFEQQRRNFLIAIAADYYDLLQARAEIVNQEESVNQFKNIEREKQALFDAGRAAAFEKNLAANEALSSVATLALQKEAYILQLERFKIRLGLLSTDPIELTEPELEVPEPEVSLADAVELALLYRLDLQNQRDQVDDSRRALANAKNGLLPDLQLSARVGVPTNPRRNVGGLAFSSDDVDYNAAATLGLPLDRDIERLAVRSASIALQARERDFTKSRDEAAVSVRQAVRNIDLARFQLKLAENQVEINRRRVRETELKRDEVTTQTRVDAANELRQSQNNRDRSRTALRNSVLRYLNDSGQLRVARDGTFLPLPGMVPPTAAPEAPAPAEPVPLPPPAGQ